MKSYVDKIKSKRIKSIIIVATIMLFSCLIAYIYKDSIVGFYKEPEIVKAKIESYGIFGPLVFILVFVFQIIVAFIPGEPLEIVAGYAFGIFWGTIIVLIATTIGSFIVFQLTRKFGLRFVKLFISGEKIDSLEYLKDSKELHNVIFTLFLIPGTPKDLFTYFIGLTKIKLSDWIVLATIARFPSVVSSVIAGNAIVSKNNSLVVIVFIVTGTLSVLGLYFYNKYIDKRNNK